MKKQLKKIRGFFVGALLVAGFVKLISTISGIINSTPNTNTNAQTTAKEVTNGNYNEGIFLFNVETETQEK